MPVPEGEVVDVARRDLLGGDHDVVAVGLARDRDGAVDHPDPPGRGRRVTARVEVAQRTVWRALGREDRSEHHDVARRQVHRRVVRVEDRDQIVRRSVAGQPGQVVGAIDGRLVVDVVRARDDDGTDPGLGQSLQLRGHAFDGAAGLDVRVEQVAGDQEQVHLLGERQVDRGLERRELSLSLRGSLLPKVVMACPEVDVCGVDQPQHPVVRLASLAVTGPDDTRWSMDASEAPP